MTRQKAIQFIEKFGALLVFPIQNQKEPKSIWSCFFPRTAMRWEWDESGDNRVAQLWHLREELMRSRKVVYAKWFKNRATVFSPECFRLMRASFRAKAGFLQLSSDAEKVLSVISDNSPISTKELKKTCKSQYSMPGTAVEKAMVPLWRRLLIVGFGEVDDGAFPSLAVGATDQIFEDWCEEADKLDSEKSRAELLKLWASDPSFVKELEKVEKALHVEPIKIKKQVSSRSKGKAKPAVLTYEDLIGSIKR